MSFTVLWFGLSAQIKVTSNGNVGISNNSPQYKFDVNSLESRFYSGKNSLLINLNGKDPMLVGNEKIVFYKADGTGFANIECQVTLQYSDSSAKENIASLEKQGLAAIDKLRGVTFSLKNDANKKKQAGFLAQEVEPVIPEAVYTNELTKGKSLAYSSIMPYLVEAIKEQQVQIEELKNVLVAMEEELLSKGIITTPLQIESALNSGETKAHLDQNIPNPFSRETRIGCFIPDAANSSFLNNYNMNGTKLQQYNINGKGKQFVTIDGSSFAPGTYFYSLFIDGKKVDTRKMILKK